MEKFRKVLSFVLSLAFVFGLVPAIPRAKALMDVSIIVDYVGLSGGFKCGTYENVATVWEDIYYNSETGETTMQRIRDIRNISNVTGNDIEPDIVDTNTEENTTINIEEPTERAPLENNTQEEDSRANEHWHYQPMYLAAADQDGIHRISDYYLDMTGLSETGHAAAQDFHEKWGVINYLGDVIYDFTYDRLTDLPGYTGTRGTSRPATGKGFQFGRASENSTTADVGLVIRQDSNTRSYRNGYLVIEDTQNRMDIQDEDKQYILPKDYKYSTLSDVSNTGIFWAGSEGEILAVMQIGEGISSVPTDEKDEPIVPGPGYDPDLEEYIYDIPDPAEDMMLPIAELDKITDTASAVAAVNVLTDGMTDEQKKCETGIDLATLYAETAVMRAACKDVGSDGNLLINAAMVRDLEPIAVQTQKAADAALASGNVITVREIIRTAVLTTDASAVTVRLAPDLLNTQFDAVRVETPTFALTFTLEELREDLTQELTFQAEDIGTGYAPSKTKRAAGNKTTVKIDVPRKKMTNPIGVSMAKTKGSSTWQTVADTSGKATASKHNRATDLVDGKVNSTGNYTVQYNDAKNFTDIANKSAEMQKAIRFLASKGIIEGTTETTFSPNGSISRAEIAMLVVKALGKLDNSASAGFKDVTRGSWYYSAAASSQRHGYIKGYADNTFRGSVNINRVQNIAVCSRVLQKHVKYKASANQLAALSKYSDKVDFWAQADVAFATQRNLVVYRKDGTFSGARNMSRGDAAILVYRLFQKVR